jgi:hypothetical protein
MNINEAKKRIKEKGYSIRTIYDPNTPYWTIQILEHGCVVYCYFVEETEYEERVLYIEKHLNIINKFHTGDKDHK